MGIKVMMRNLLILLVGVSVGSSLYADAVFSIYSFQPQANNPLKVSYSTVLNGKTTNTVGVTEHTGPVTIPIQSELIHLTLRSAINSNVYCQYDLPIKPTGKIAPLSTNGSCPVLVLSIQHYSNANNQSYTNYGLTPEGPIGPSAKEPPTVKVSQVTLKVCNKYPHSALDSQNTIVWLETAKTIPPDSCQEVAANEYFYHKGSQQLPSLLAYYNRITLIWQDLQEISNKPNNIPGNNQTPVTINGKDYFLGYAGQDYVIGILELNNTIVNHKLDPPFSKENSIYSINFDNQQAYADAKLSVQFLNQNQAVYNYQNLACNFNSKSYCNKDNLVDIGSHSYCLVSTDFHEPDKMHKAQACGASPAFQMQVNQQCSQPVSINDFPNYLTKRDTDYPFVNFANAMTYECDFGDGKVGDAGMSVKTGHFDTLQLDVSPN